MSDKKEKEQLFDLVEAFAKCVKQLPEKAQKSKKISEYKTQMFEALADLPKSAAEILILAKEIIDDHKAKSHPPELLQFAYLAAWTGFHAIPEGSRDCTDYLDFAAVLMHEEKYDMAASYLTDAEDGHADEMKEEELLCMLYSQQAACQMALGRLENAKKYAVKAILTDIENSLYPYEPNADLLKALSHDKDLAPMVDIVKKVGEQLHPRNRQRTPTAL